MGALFGFAVGYLLGAREGRSGYLQFVQAVQDVRQSEEFRSLSGLVRDHAGQTMQAIGAWVVGGGTATDLDEMLRGARERLDD